MRMHNNLATQSGGRNGQRLQRRYQLMSINQGNYPMSTQVTLSSAQVTDILSSTIIAYLPLHQILRVTGLLKLLKCENRRRMTQPHSRMCVLAEVVGIGRATGSKLEVDWRTRAGGFVILLVSLQSHKRNYMSYSTQCRDRASNWRLGREH